MILMMTRRRRHAGRLPRRNTGPSRATRHVPCSAEINQCVRPAWRYYLLFWPPRRSARVLGVLARDVLGLLTRTGALVDTELRPDAEEGRALKRVMSAPGDSLASSDLELLWKFRHALTGEKKALPKFLLAVDWRDATEVAQVPALLKQWTRIDVADAIKLLGPDQAYQRRVVRAFAVDALRQASDIELVTYLLQLVQALRYDEKDEKGRSPLASFLSERAARSIAVANFVWWYLKVGVRMRRQTASLCRVSPLRHRRDASFITRRPRTRPTSNPARPTASSEEDLPKI